MANNKKAKIERDSFEDVVEFQKNMYNPGYYVGTGKVPPTISAPGNAKLSAVINFLASALFLGAGLFLFFADDIFKGQSKPVVTNPVGALIFMLCISLFCLLLGVGYLRKAKRSNKENGVFKSKQVNKHSREK